MSANSQGDPTARYLAENERVRRLERHTLSGFKKAYWPTSVLWLLRWKRQELRNLKDYRHEKRVGAKWLEALRGLQGSKAGRSALVVGNGPSQGYLPVETLAAFVDAGGEVLAVNYWPENEALCRVAPNYLVISDPNTLKAREADEPAPPRDALLQEYLAAHRAINLVFPVLRCDELAVQFGRDRVIGFVDTEMRLWTDNISPLKPRGYTSMTLYKALALAIHLGYSNIFILGMDNTYPRTIYCDENNRIQNVETHTAIDDWLVDMGDCYGGMGDLLYALSTLFYDLRKFRSTTSELLNLDPYSLTDVFPKARTIDVAKSLLPAHNRVSR